jgi:hypothetical protein
VAVAAVQEKAHKKLVRPVVLVVEVVALLQQHQVLVQ